MKLTFTTTGTITTTEQRVSTGDTIVTTTTIALKLTGDTPLTINYDDVVKHSDFYVKLKDGREFGTLYSGDEMKLFIEAARYSDMTVE